MKRGLQEIVDRIEKNDEQFDYVVGIARGGLIPAVHLSHSLGIPLLCLDYSLRDKQVVNYEYRRIIRDICDDISEGKKILLVDDIVDSGATFYTVKNMLVELVERKLVKSQVRTCSLFWNPINKYNEVVDYYHMIHDEKFWITFSWEV